MQQPEILLVAFSMSGLTYVIAGMMMTLQKEEFVRWGHLMRNDSIIAMVAIGSVSAIQLLLGFVQNIISESAGSALISPNQAYATIMAQLLAIDTALIVIVGTISAVPFLQGVSIVIGHVLGSAVSTVTGAIILWTGLQTMSNIMPTIFLILFSIGLLLWSIPFRIGRTAGSTIMALSMVLLIGLPLAAPTAIWIEGYVMTSSDLDSLTNNANKWDIEIKDPIFFTDLLVPQLTQILPRIIGSIVVSLIIFPMIYLALLGIFTKAIASLIGGYTKSISIKGLK